ncbi:MAG: succinylglutamate desuccinylase/aspartoacylase family protein [Bacteriovoracaceae bacterium]|nr:succinylglutamate desuccinylase/aspartoacylase family protein [Bacteriovoracaceae bacterium]
MKILIILILAICFTTQSMAICVHEKKLSGFELLDALTHEKASEFHVEINDRFYPMDKLPKLNPASSYTVQWGHSKETQGYDDKYIKYYRYSRIQEFIAENKSEFIKRGYRVEIIGKSVKGRNLYSVFPSSFSSEKKTVLMYGRHHGDEGTANWIIEGFIGKLLSSNDFFNRFQLILYPMVNPDGAEARKRYNSRGRDLNRVWNSSPSRSKDEVAIIQTHLKKIYLDNNEKPIIALDMHGSFTRDFIYRVERNFRDQNFYNLQQNFIDELGSRDKWQAGAYDLSNGDPQMARIYLVRDFAINALTHETPRDISNRGERTIDTLKSQGVDVFESILSLY